MIQKGSIICCMIGVAIIGFSVWAGEVGDDRPVKTYQSIREIFKDIPPELLPHRITKDANPILKARAGEWLKENVNGCRLVLKKADLLRIWPPSSIDVVGIDVSADPGFTMGGVKHQVAGVFDRKRKIYKGRGPIRCTLWESWRRARKPVRPADDSLARENAEKRSIQDRLLKLNALQKDRKGKITQRPSKVTVVGTISNFSAGLSTWNTKRPFVSIGFSLVDAEMK